MTTATAHAEKYDANISLITRLEKLLIARKSRKDAAWGDTYPPMAQVGICLALAAPLVSWVLL